jgi:hypothetical protein
MANHSDTRPERILLHLARREGAWMGRAVRFSRDEEYQFASLDELVAWIEGVRKPWKRPGSQADPGPDVVRIDQEEEEDAKP